MLAASPASGHYQLQAFGFGSGGVDNATSGSYALNGITGETSGDQLSSGSYKVGSGLIFTQQADVPDAPTVTNPASYYDKLHFVLNPGPNASDATFAIAASTDGFVTTKYVKADHTVGSSLALADYQTYVNWNSASGFDVIGLSSGSTYTFKVKAMHGKFTETGYGPSASVATVDPSLVFDIDVAATDTETASPYIADLGDLTAGSVTTGADRVWVDLETNADSGATVYISSANTGLSSTSAAHTIASSSTDLAVASEGYGAQGASATQSAGGPLSLLSPYDGSVSNVGIIDSTLRTIFRSAGPITAGRGSLLLKAKIAATTPAADDYTDSLTLVAAGVY